MDCSCVGPQWPASKGSDFQITSELSSETSSESLASMGRDDLGGGRGSAVSVQKSWSLPCQPRIQYYFVGFDLNGSLLLQEKGENSLSWTIQGGRLCSTKRDSEQCMCSHPSLLGSQIMERQCIVYGHPGTMLLLFHSPHLGNSTGFPSFSGHSPPSTGCMSSSHPSKSMAALESAGSH